MLEWFGADLLSDELDSVFVFHPTFNQGQRHQDRSSVGNREPTLKLSSHCCFALLFFFFRFYQHVLKNEWISPSNCVNKHKKGGCESHLSTDLFLFTGLGIFFFIFISFTEQKKPFSWAGHWLSLTSGGSRRLSWLWVRREDACVCWSSPVAAD